VAGFDGRSVVSRMLVPALTTVAMPLAEIAARLVDRVIDQANGASRQHGEIVGATFVPGQSA
jgi:DNA-binding LacI/PurR family transcriptional regulator